MRALAIFKSSPAFFAFFAFGWSPRDWNQVANYSTTPTTTSNARAGCTCTSEVRNSFLCVSCLLLFANVLLSRYRNQYWCTPLCNPQSSTSDIFDSPKADDSYTLDNRKERVQFDKITARVSRLCYGLDPDHIDAAAITQKVISGVYQGVTTIELDNLVGSASNCHTYW